MSYANANIGAPPRTPPRPTRFQAGALSPAYACSGIAPIPFPSLDGYPSEQAAAVAAAEAAAALTDLQMLQKSSRDLTMPDAHAHSQSAFAGFSLPAYSAPAYSYGYGHGHHAPAHNAAALAFGDRLAFSCATAPPPGPPAALSPEKTARLHKAASRIASCREPPRDVLRDVLRATGLSAEEFSAFYRENRYDDLEGRKILLFDLNSTLVHRPRSEDSAGGSGAGGRGGGRRVIKTRPHIHLLSLLLADYRIGVFTSAKRHNAVAICDEVESKVGHLIFDRSLIFSREHTRAYTAEELARLELDEFKRKKVLGDLFLPEHLGKVTLVDDHLERSVLTGAHGIQIDSWYSDAAAATGSAEAAKDDAALVKLVCGLTGLSEEQLPQPPAPPRQSWKKHSPPRGSSGGGACPTTPPRSVKQRNNGSYLQPQPAQAQQARW
jgi:hypothetical protein